MDSAKYHVRKRDPRPTTAMHIADTFAWCERKGIVKLTHNNGSPMSKTWVSTFINNLQTPPIFALYGIAQDHGHIIMKAPSYHCSSTHRACLSIVKTKVAVAPNINKIELSLCNRLLGLFATIWNRKIAWSMGENRQESLGLLANLLGTARSNGQYQ